MCFFQLFHEDGECWVYDEPLLKRVASQRHWEDNTLSDTHTHPRVCVKTCTHSRVFIRTLLQKPLSFRALEWLVIERVHSFAFNWKTTTWKWMKPNSGRIKIVTWRPATLLSLLFEQTWLSQPSRDSSARTGDESSSMSPPSPSASQRHLQSAPCDKPEPHPFLHTHTRSPVGTWVKKKKTVFCWCPNHINLDKANSALHLREPDDWGEGCWPLWESDSLRTVERTNLKGQRRNSLLACN